MAHPSEAPLHEELKEHQYKKRTACRAEIYQSAACDSVYSALLDSWSHPFTVIGPANICGPENENITRWDFLCAGYSLRRRAAHPPPGASLILRCVLLPALLVSRR